MRPSFILGHLFLATRALAAPGPSPDPAAEVQAIADAIEAALLDTRATADPGNLDTLGGQIYSARNTCNDRVQALYSAIDNIRSQFSGSAFGRIDEAKQSLEGERVEMSRHLTGLAWGMKEAAKQIRGGTFDGSESLWGPR